MPRIPSRATRIRRTRTIRQSDLDAIQAIYLRAQHRAVASAIASAVGQRSDGTTRDERAEIGKIARRIARNVDKSLNQIARADAGINRLDLPASATWQKKFIKNHVDLISVVGRVEKSAVRKVLEQNPGASVRALTDKFLADPRLANVSAKRARMWAVDQTLSMHAALTKERHQTAGIAEYVWTDSGGPSGDGPNLVRPMHRELDGQKFSWSDPPVTNDDGDTNHPGGDYNCRCTAYPVTAAASVLRAGRPRKKRSKPLDKAGVKALQKRSKENANRARREMYRARKNEQASLERHVQNAQAVGTIQDLDKGQARYSFDQSTIRPLTAERRALEAAEGGADDRAAELDPIVLHVGTGGLVTLAEGRHRLLAAVEIGATRIRAIIRANGKELPARSVVIPNRVELLSLIRP